MKDVGIAEGDGMSEDRRKWVPENTKIFTL